MAKRITEAVAAELQGQTSDKDIFVFDTIVSGFALRRTPGGKVIHTASARANGRKIRTTVGFWPAMKTGEARELARLAVADIREGRDPALERRARQQTAAAAAVTVAEFAERWLVEHVQAKRKPKTVANYTLVMRRYVVPKLGRRTIGAVNFHEVHALHVNLKTTPRLANFTVDVLRSMMAHAVKAGLRPDNPCRHLARYPERARERFLSPQEFARAHQAIDEAVAQRIIGQRAAAGLKLAIYTGARRSEIRATRWSDVDWTRRLIRLPDSKTNTPRTIHLSDAAIDVLRSLPRDGVQVIGGGMEFLTDAWMTVRKRCGLEDVRLHDLRHSFASAALAAGLPLAVVGRLLGHKRASTTERYAHLAADDVAAANDAVGEALADMMAPKAAGTVVKLPRRRGRR